MVKVPGGLWLPKKPVIAAGFRSFITDNLSAGVFRG